MTLWFPFVLFLVKSEAAIFLFYFFYLIKNWLKVDHWGGNLSSQIFDSLLELSSLIYDCKIGHITFDHITFFTRLMELWMDLPNRAREQTWRIYPLSLFFFFFWYHANMYVTFLWIGAPRECHLVSFGSIHPNGSGSRTELFLMAY